MKPDTVGLPDSLGGEVIRVTDTDGDRATWTFPADPNAARAARRAVREQLRRSAGPDGVLLLEVSDPVPEPPRTRDVRLDDESGRGLQLLARSSRRWGHRTGPHGKTVWCELAVPR